MDFIGTYFLPLIIALFIQRTQTTELVTETGQERNCTASRAEVGGRMPCGNGYITKQEACWECGCCFVDDSNDNETVNVCYDPMNGTGGGDLAQSTGFKGDASSFCNQSFEDIIGTVTVNRTPNWELIPWNTTVSFVIEVQTVVTRMATLFHFDDGCISGNISFLKTEEMFYHEARLEHTYRCPGELYQPSLELQGQVDPKDRFEVPAGPAFNVTQELFVDYRAEDNGSTTFAIYTNISDENISIWIDFGDGNASQTVPTLVPCNRSNLPEWALQHWMERDGEAKGYSVGFVSHFYHRVGEIRPIVVLTIAECAQNFSYQMSAKVGSLERFRKQLEAMEASSSSMETIVLPGESVEVIAWIPGDVVTLGVTLACFDYGDGEIDERVTIKSFDNEEWPTHLRWKAVGTQDGLPSRIGFIQLSHVYNASGDYQGRLTVAHDQVNDWTASVNVSIKVWNFSDALGRVRILKNTSDIINPFEYVAFEVTVDRVFCNLTLDADFGDNSTASDNFRRDDGALLNNLSRYASVLPGSAFVVHQYGYRPDVYVVTVRIPACSDLDLMQSIATTNVTVRSFSEAIGEVAITSLNRVNLVLCDLSVELQIGNPWPLGEFSVSFADGTPAEIVPRDAFQTKETPNGTFHVATVRHRFVVPGTFPVSFKIVDTISKDILMHSNIIEVITVRQIVGNISLTRSKDSIVCQGDVVDVAVTLERIPSHDQVMSVDFGDGTDPHIVLLTKKSLMASDLEKYSFVETHRFKEPRNYTVTATIMNPCTTEDRVKAELRVDVFQRSSSSMTEGRELDRVLLIVNPAHTHRTVVGEEVEFMGAIPAFFEDPRPVVLFLDGSEAPLRSSLASNCLTLFPDWLPTEFSFSSARLFPISHKFPRPGVYHVRLKVTNHPGRPGPIFTQASVTVFSLRDAVGSVRIVSDISNTGNASVLVLAEHYPVNVWTLWDFGDGTPSRRLDLKRNAQLPEFASEFATPGHFSELLSHTYAALAVLRFSVTFQAGDGGPFRNFTRVKTIAIRPCDEMMLTFENSAEDDLHLSNVYFWNETIVLRATFTPACYPVQFAGRCVLDKRSTLEEGVTQLVRLHGLSCSVSWSDQSSIIVVTIDPFVLQGPGTYSIGLEAWFINSKNVVITAQSNATVILRIELYRKSQLMVLTRPVAEYNVSETFWMNATLLDDIHASSEMVAYSWVCLMPGIQPPTTAHNIHHLSECTSEPYRPDRSKSSLELPASWLSFDPHKLPVVFHFQALLSTPNRTLASDWVRLTIVAGDSPLVEIVCRENCGEDVNPSETVILSFSCSNCGDKERLNKSWDIRRDHPDISKTNLSDFLKSSPKMDGDVFAIPAQVFESTERDEVLIVSLQVRRRDATHGSSIRRFKATPSSVAQQSITRKRITPGMEEKPIVPISSLSDNEPSRVLTPSFGALLSSNDSSPASGQVTSTNLAALATIALLVPAAAILATVVIHRKRLKSKERDGDEARLSRNRY